MRSHALSATIITEMVAQDYAAVVCGAESEIGTWGVCAAGLCGVWLGSKRRRMLACGHLTRWRSEEWMFDAGTPLREGASEYIVHVDLLKRR